MKKVVSLWNMSVRGGQRAEAQHPHSVFLFFLLPSTGRYAGKMSIRHGKPRPCFRAEK